MKLICWSETEEGVKTEEGVRLCILTFNKKCQNAEPDPFCISPQDC